MQKQITEVSAAVKAAKKTEGAQPWLKPKAEKVPIQLDPMHLHEVKLNNGPSGLGEVVVVVITDGQYTHQITYHHPIGVTKLQPDDWVATRTGDIQSFWANREDPSKKRKEEAKKVLFLESALKNKLYRKDDKTKEYWHLNDDGTDLMSFKAATQEAEKHWEAARDAAFKEYLEDCKAANREPKKTWAFGRPKQAFLPDSVKKREEKVKKTLEAIPEFETALKAIETPFETTGGPDGRRPQVRVGTEYPHTQAQMVDAITRDLMNTSAGYKFPVVGSKSLQNDWGTKTETEVMKEIMTKLFPPPPETTEKGETPGKKKKG